MMVSVSVLEESLGRNVLKVARNIPRMAVLEEPAGRNIPEIARNIPQMAVPEEPAGRNVPKMARNIPRMANWEEAIVRIAKHLAMEEAMVMVMATIPEELLPGRTKVETVPEELVRRNIPRMANMQKHCVVLEGKVMVAVIVSEEPPGRNVPGMARNIPWMAVPE
jgi:hypothetical protein